MDAIETIVEVCGPERSAGGDNAYYIPGCDVVQHSPAYASCLSKIQRAKAKDKTLGALFSDCKDAINQHRCKAMRMQREEQAEGKALYYVSRAQLLLEIAERERIAGERLALIMSGDRLPSSRRPRRSSVDLPIRAPRTTASAPAAPESVLDRVEAGYAAALNQALREESKSSVSSTVIPAASAAGESLLERARRQLAAKQQ